MIVINIVILQGRPTRDPYLGQSHKGTIFCKIRLAVDRSYTGKERKTDYLNIICYGKLAQTMHNNLCKGALITVRGELYQDEFIDAIGNKRETNYVKANQITIHEWLKKHRPLEDFTQGFDDMELIPREITGSLFKQIDFADEDIPDDALGELPDDLL